MAAPCSAKAAGDCEGEGQRLCAVGREGEDGEAMTLEADGIIDVWDIDTGKMIAQYEGLEVHDAMQSIAQLRAEIEVDKMMNEAQWKMLDARNAAIAQLNEQIAELWVQLAERDATIAVMRARLAAVPIAQLRSLGNVDGDEAP